MAAPNRQGFGVWDPADGVLWTAYARFSLGTQRTLVVTEHGGRKNFVNFFRDDLDHQKVFQECAGWFIYAFTGHYPRCKIKGSR